TPPAQSSAPQTSTQPTFQTSEARTTAQPDTGGVAFGSRNALRAVESYLSLSDFPATGLYGQRMFEGSIAQEAQYVVDDVSVAWHAQDLGSANSYLDYSSFSKSSLYEQLIYEEFTPAQAQYGVDSVSADWFAEAAESAEGYIAFSAFSESGLYDQLLYEGFTP